MKDANRERRSHNPAPPSGLRTSLVVTALLLLATVVGALAPADWTGHWKLDTARSDPAGELMKALEVPWYARAAAALFRPTLEVSVFEGGLEIAMVTFFGATRERVYGDNVERDGKDPLGRPYRERSEWAGKDEIRIYRRLSLESGRTANIEALWKVDSDAITSSIQVRNQAGTAIQVRRVFARLD